MSITYYRSFLLPLYALLFSLSIPLNSTAKASFEVPGLSVSVSGEDISLEWRTRDKQLSGSFELERSLNGEEFVSLGIQHLIQQRDYATIYSFTDSKILKLGLPKFFYRLKYNAADGQISYGEIKEVSSLADKKEISLIGHQQISKNKYVIHFKAKGKVSMSVINMLGQVKFKQKYQDLKGAKTIYLFTENWDSGAYVIDLKQGQQRSRYKFVLP